MNPADAAFAARGPGKAWARARTHCASKAGLPGAPTEPVKAPGSNGAVELLRMPPGNRPAC